MRYRAVAFEGAKVHSSDRREGRLTGFMVVPQGAAQKYEARRGETEGEVCIGR